jgi:hypothetical protein
MAPCCSSDLGGLQGQAVSPVANPPLSAALAGPHAPAVSSLTEQEDDDRKLRYDTALEAYVPCILDGRVVGAYELYTQSGPLVPMRWTIWTSVGLGFALLLCGIAALRYRSGGAAVSLQAAGAVGPRRPPPVVRTGLVRLQASGEEADAPRPRQSASADSPARVNPALDCRLSRHEMDVPAAGEPPHVP